MSNRARTTESVRFYRNLCCLGAATFAVNAATCRVGNNLKGLLVWLVVSAVLMTWALLLTIILELRSAPPVEP